MPDRQGGLDDDKTMNSGARPDAYWTRKETSRKWKKLYGQIIPPFVAFSTICVGLSTMPEYEGSFFFEVIEIIMGSVVIIELVFRGSALICKKGYWKHLMSRRWRMGIFWDFVTLIPIVMQWSDSEYYRHNPYVQGIKCFRILKCIRHYPSIVILLERSVATAFGATFTAFFFLVMVGTVFAASVYIAEFDEVPEVGHFHTLPNALWFVVVTMSTVGYGDVVPKTTLGRALSSVSICFGLIFLAMPLAVIGQSFTDSWNKRDRIFFSLRCQEEFGDYHRLMSEVAERAFKSFDLDADGFVTCPEFMNGLDRLGMTNLTKKQVWGLWSAIDKDTNGVLDYNQFVSFMMEYSPEKVAGGDHEMTDAEREELSQIVDGGANHMHKSMGLMIHKLKMHFKKEEVDEAILAQTFRLMDTDGNGQLTFNELVSGIQSLGVTVAFSDLNALWRELDEDGGGSVDFQEFVTFIFNTQNEMQNENFHTSSSDLKLKDRTAHDESNFITPDASQAQKPKAAVVEVAPKSHTSTWTSRDSKEVIVVKSDMDSLVELVKAVQQQNMVLTQRLAETNRSMEKTQSMVYQLLQGKGVAAQSQTKGGVGRGGRGGQPGPFNGDTVRSNMSTASRQPAKRGPAQAQTRPAPGR